MGQSDQVTIMRDITFKKIHEDARGKLYEFSFNGKNFLLVTYVKGAPRGGHYHEFDLPHVVVSGKFLCRELNLETNEESEFEIKPGDVVNVRAKIVHMFIALEDGIMLELKPDNLAVDYPPWRKIVEDFLAKEKV